MTEKEIVKLREILGRIARRSEHKPDLELIKSLAIEADSLVKESDSLPCVSSLFCQMCGKPLRTQSGIIQELCECPSLTK